MRIQNWLIIKHFCCFNCSQILVVNSADPVDKIQIQSERFWHKFQALHYSDTAQKRGELTEIEVKIGSARYVQFA